MQPHFLMCRPEHFAVTYAINPWMDPPSWAVDDRALATAASHEWQRLHRHLVGLGAAVELVPPEAQLPDLVFTANAAVVLDGTALLARFRHAERQGEEAPLAAAFARLRAAGTIDRVLPLPPGVTLEGAGDCVWDGHRHVFWMGWGPRSDVTAAPAVAAAFGVETVALELVDPRFYHMDTALCPLDGGELLYFPGAFTAAGLAAIRERVPPELRLEIGEADAGRLAANAVSLGGTVLLSRCGAGLRARLRERGYRVEEIGLDAFRRSGGSAFCLTLRLDRRSTRVSAMDAGRADLIRSPAAA